MGSVAVVVVVALGAGIGLFLWFVGAPVEGRPAPRLSPDFATAVLQRAGFPPTRHNVYALRERLGMLFLAEARAGAAPEGWDRVVARCESARADMARWPQHVLEVIAESDHEAAAVVAHRCPELLLATVGTGRGFFGGSVFEPLPTATPVTVPA